MTNHFSIQYHPVFEERIFEKHPDLFHRFTHRTPQHLQKEYQESLETLRRYEGVITWPIITGPGFSGATHPGTDNVLVTTIVSPNDPIYNSDCLYVNPAQKIFAISDAPGRSTASRKLFAELDHYMQSGSTDNLTAMVNDLNEKTGMEDGATLSLAYFPQTEPGNGLNEALVFIAGDTYLLHGNIFGRRMTRIEGNPEFMGFPHIHLEPKRIHLDRGDFFVIASDGILSIRVNNYETRLEEILMDYVEGDRHSFALSVIRSCNRLVAERVYDRVVVRFGGSDNVSVLLVYPEELTDIDCKESFILGGYSF